MLRSWAPVSSGPACARRVVVCAKGRTSSEPPRLPRGASDEEGVPWSVAQHCRVTDLFLKAKLAKALRAAFESHFDTPRQTRAESFCWSYWHVPGQYTQLRTPAQDFFQPELFAQLEAALLEHGRTQLGCGAISPLWLSMYTSSMKQELHADVPHGPFALVLSLTRTPRAFSGGETMLLQPHVLDYWRGFSYDRVVESEQLVTLVAPDFNRLTVFDARFPHGVRPVEGVMDPLQARVVLHGWYTEPRPFFEGALSEDDATDALNDALTPLFEALGDAPAAMGILCVRMRVQGGRVKSLEALSDTLMPHPGCGDVDEARRQVLEIVRSRLLDAAFPDAEGDTFITMPFVFE